MAETINAFPLTIYKDRIDLDGDERDRLAGRILEMQGKTPEEKRGSSWTGDVKGFEFLHQDADFQPLLQKLGATVRAYMEALGIDSDRFGVYFTRSWGTVSLERERIAPHAHMQSHISVSYYLKKPANSGGIQFHQRESANEFIGSLFTQRMVQAGVLKKLSHLNTNVIAMEPEEGDVIVFPSKTEHSTAPNQSGEPRISIAIDVIVALRESAKLEWGLPDPKNWKGY